MEHTGASCANGRHRCDRYGFRPSTLGRERAAAILPEARTDLTTLTGAELGVGGRDGGRYASVAPVAAGEGASPAAHLTDLGGYRQFSVAQHHSGLSNNETDYRTPLQRRYIAFVRYVCVRLTSRRPGHVTHFTTYGFAAAQRNGVTVAP
jgi:hypothetical protein